MKGDVIVLVGTDTLKGGHRTAAEVLRAHEACSFVPIIIEFNNEATAEILTGFINDMAIGEDGWAQIAPFGDFPGFAIIADGKGGYAREMAIQRVDEKAVIQMVNEFEQAMRGPTRFLKGRPIYHGHPDSPAGGKYPDKEPKGVFAHLARRDKGLYGEAILTERGEQLVADKEVRAFSGRWEANEYVGEEMHQGRKVKVFRPTRFLSAGLVKKSNLPVEMFNEAIEEGKIMEKSKVIAVLTAHGITIANDATDEQVAEGLKNLGEKCNTLQTEKATFANEKATLESNLQAEKTKVTTLTTEKGTAITERDTAKTQFANERKARIEGELSQAIKAGRITAAEKADWERRLGIEAQFANELEALHKLTAKVKTESVTLQRGDRKVEISNASERREMVNDLVSEEMSASKVNYDVAFGRVQKKYPQLFEAMEQPPMVQKGGAKVRA